MALHLYHDSGATNLIEDGDEDSYRGAVPASQTATHEEKIYIGSDDSGLTYESIEIDTVGDEDGASTSGEVNVQYAVDNSGSAGTYSETLTLSNGDFDPAIPIWRKITAPNLQSAFKRTDIQHRITYDEYVK
jgi:hypothetical protein